MNTEEDEIDRCLVIATQSGLPLVSRPYQLLGEQLGISAEEVMLRLKRMLACLLYTSRCV